MPDTKINWDALGITTSIACAIHCALLPIFISTLPLFGINIIHNLTFEYGMITLAFLIGAYSLYHGRKKHHQKWTPLIIFSAGIVFLLAKEVWNHWELWFLVPAVILIISGHVMNYRYCRVSDHNVKEDCDH
jgi:phosphatidylglycerophosphate synthase